MRASESRPRHKLQRRRTRAPRGFAGPSGATARSRARALLPFLAAAATLAGLAGLGTWARASNWDTTALRQWLRGPAFQLQTVLILGLDALRPADVLAQSGLRAGIPLIDLNLESLRVQIEANPRIRHCWGARLFPNRILLEVEERQPVARLAKSRDAIDREGARFPLTPNEGADLPEISGDPGAALALLAAADQAGIEIASVRVQTPGDLLIRRRHSPVRLRVGRDAARSFGDWERLRSSGALRDFSGSEIDLRFRGNAILAGDTRVSNGG